MYSFGWLYNDYDYDDNNNNYKNNNFECDVGMWTIFGIHHQYV